MSRTCSLAVLGCLRRRGGRKIVSQNVFYSFLATYINFQMCEDRILSTHVHYEGQPGVKVHSRTTKVSMTKVIDSNVTFNLSISFQFNLNFGESQVMRILLLTSRNYSLVKNKNTLQNQNKLHKNTKMYKKSENTLKEHICLSHLTCS